MQPLNNSSSRSSNLSHALVIGGSIGGLLAGRVLANHFQQVTIIERDIYPDAPVPRKGVPQSQHLHALLTRGQMILEELFPGLKDELIAAGAPLLEVGSDSAWYSRFGWAVRFNSGIKIIALSRGLLDFCVHRRMNGIPNLRFLLGATVTKLLANGDNTGIAGVSVRWRNPSDGSIREEQLLADLVVDASGKTSKAPEWLKELGYIPPKETVVNPFVGYASRIYRRPENFQADWQSLFVQSAPPEGTRGGVLFPIEGDRWIAGMGGINRDYPPTDEAGFLEFVRSLPTPAIYEAIKEAEPLTPIYGYRDTENRLRHYDSLPRYPENFLVVGHAACAFNPVYGQGITVAALEAQTLDKCLHQHSNRNFKGFARQVQKQLATVHAVPWMAATSEDYRSPGTEGGKPDFFTQLMHRYMDGILQLAMNNTDVYRRFLEVMHMLKPSTALFHPRIFIQVLRQIIQSSPSSPEKSVVKGGVEKVMS
ncbi:NAD(P)/FAD-dependent oxidoreductase [Microseira sp. BLCC-F43]|jgi:2-polyprenyl-6-methoxyphenol hydroxylase-like FAD-dependent oxidoreductase|uniref:NAD(P)/FAD-dependent oxidoreductase n=1 Tax=Microseira sp. BLCC-F43 TaxID=3153602 RepID=UPI0035B9EDC8